MPTRDLSMTDFPQTVDADGIVLVDFWAAWCPPCRMFAPVYDSASDKHEDIVFTKVDTEANQDLAGAMGITSIPTLMAFRDGIRVFSQAGALPATALGDLIGQIRALDMDEVRAQATHLAHERTNHS